jgi:hypothetical protein
VRRSLAILSLVVAAGSTTVIGDAAPVSAASLGLVCTSVSGEIAGIGFSGCSGAGATGGLGFASPWAAPGTPAIVHWANGQTTVLSLTSKPVAKDERERSTHMCPSSPEISEEVISGTVIADTTGIAVGGSVRGEICFDISTQTLFNEPGGKFRIH